MDASLVQKAHFEVFCPPEILVYIELHFKIDILLSILLCIQSGDGESLITCRPVFQFKCERNHKMHRCISNGQKKMHPDFQEGQQLKY